MGGGTVRLGDSGEEKTITAPDKWTGEGTESCTSGVVLEDLTRGTGFRSRGVLRRV